MEMLMVHNMLLTKIEALTRFFMVRYLSGYFPLYIVVEYPKSGGSWVSQMLAECLNVPFPRNRFPKLESCIMHEHYLYHPSMKNVFVVLRDGRDVMVSYYFHCLFKNELFNHRLVDMVKKDLKFSEPDDIRSNLPKFIEYSFVRKRYPRFSWSQFVDIWYGRAGGFVKYENLLTNPTEELSQAISSCLGRQIDKEHIEKIVQKYDFSTLTKRKPGIEQRNSFLRKGIAGDWKNYFSREAREVFNFFGGKQLIRLGYEQDDSWVTETD